MTDELRRLLLRLAAGLLVVAGLVAMVAGYLGVRDQSDVVLQLPYAISGGLGGLGLILTGAVLLVHEQMREQLQASADVIDSLEEWKENALTEVRTFLENATIEVEVVEAPAATNGRAKKPRAGTRS